MQWYELSNGPLRALKVLLDSPLSFDPLEYLERTFYQRNIDVEQGLLEFSKIFNELRLGLLQGVSGVNYHLSNTGKLTLSNFDGTTRPIHVCFDGAAINNKSVIEKTCDSTNLQVDRLLESFGVNVCNGSELTEEISDYISFYLLSEAMFFCLVDMAKVKTYNDKIEIKPKNTSVVNQLHRKWFANYWERCSTLSNMATLDLLEPGIDKNPYFPELIETMSIQFKDKVFSLPTDNLPDRIKRMESIKWVSKLCKLTVLCLWCQLKGKMKLAPLSLIEKVGVSNNDLIILKNLLSEYPEPDRIFSFKEKGVELINPSMTDQLRLILNDLANKISEKKLNDLIGDFFEKEHVKGYFYRKDISEKYNVYEGILPHDVKDVSLKPDVDFILHDTRRDKFYFIQVKYLRVGGKNYISGDLDHILSGKLLKGVKQLVHAKQAMINGGLSSILESRGIKNANINNSVFLLIHNIYNFDFCSWPSGVVSYEWNSIRNLFNDGQVIFGPSQSIPNVSKLSRSLPIETPDEVIEILMNNVPESSFGKASTLFETDKLTMSVELGGKQFSMSGLGL